MELGLRERVALVTGASSGLGLAIARELAAEGARVAMVARRGELLRAMADEIAAAGGRAHAVVGDVGTPGEAERLVRETGAALGPVDILVANAGGPPSTSRPVAGSCPTWPLRKMESPPRTACENGPTGGPILSLVNACLAISTP